MFMVVCEKSLVTPQDQISQGRYTNTPPKKSPKHDFMVCVSTYVLNNFENMMHYPIKPTFTQNTILFVKYLCDMYTRYSSYRS